MSNFLIKSIDERGVARICLNREEIHNAFNDQLINDIINALIEFEENSQTRILVLEAKGKSFCAGADLNWMKSMKDYSFEQNYADSQRLNELFHRLNTFSRPVIGRINGAALGGGVGLVACCDYVIAVDTAKFGLTEVRLGLVPAVISPYVISKIGESQARAWFLSGERFDAHKAKEMNLVHEVVAEGDLDTAVESQIKKYEVAGPMATRVAKKLIADVLKIENESRDHIYRYTCETISELRISVEGQEGMASLLEKRSANWIKK